MLEFYPDLYRYLKMESLNNNNNPDKPKLKHEYHPEVKGPIKARIYRVNQDKGFAFATGDDKRDYFLYFRQFKRSGPGSIAFRNLESGMAVEFEYRENLDSKKAPAGMDVRLILGEIPL